MYTELKEHLSIFASLITFADLSKVPYKNENFSSEWYQNLLRHSQAKSYQILSNYYSKNPKLQSP